MKTSRITQAIAGAAAVITTLVVFSNVVSLADQDKAALLAARIAPAKIAAVTDPARP